MPEGRDDQGRPDPRLLEQAEAALLLLHLLDLLDLAVGRLVTDGFVVGDLLEDFTRLFLLALEKAQTRREAAVVVGDSWTLDVLGAHQAGIRSIWLNRRQEPCPDPRLTTELAAFEPLEHTLKALEAP